MKFINYVSGLSCIDESDFKYCYENSLFNVKEANVHISQASS